MCSAFKISAIKEFFYHSEFGNCKKISAIFPNLEPLPKSEMRFQIRKRFRIPKFPEVISRARYVNVRAYD